MRREERHHLKENPLAIVLAEARRRLADSGRPILFGGGVVLAALIAVGGYFSWNQIKERRAGELLAEAMSTLQAEVVSSPEEPIVTVQEPNGNDVMADESAGDNIDDTTTESTEGETASDEPSPSSSMPIPSSDFVQPPGTYPSLDTKLESALPELLAVADSYPSIQQGLIARYQAAAVLIELERADEAATQYRQVMNLAGEALYGQMSRMGLVEALLLTGQAQEAIPLLESQTAALESLVPVDAVLMRLGYAYELAGQPDEALAVLNRVVEEFPVSMYLTDAQQKIEILRQGNGTPLSE